jgi:methionyl-tRNA formyltransferase
MRIVFMGTPELAAHCLSRLIDSGFNIVGVVTAPDKPAGRGRKLQQSPVKQLALTSGIPVLQPERFKSSDFLDQLYSLKPDIQVVVAFRMLPEEVWSLPPKGTFNMHASLLPDYRGAAPINWVLINGETETGVTTFLLDHKIDTGRILFQEKLRIDDDETAGSLHEKVKEPAAKIIIKTIQAIDKGHIEPVPQSELFPGKDTLHTAPKLYREDCRIDWNRSCHHIINLIRGLSPSPGAFCDIHDDERTINMKIFEASSEKYDHDHSPGTIFSDNKRYVYVAAADGVVKIHQLQLPGKKVMKTQELLRGFHFKSAVNSDL